MSPVFTKIYTKTNFDFVGVDANKKYSIKLPEIVIPKNTYKNTYMHNITFFTHILSVSCAMLPLSPTHQFDVHEKYH